MLQSGCKMIILYVSVRMRSDMNVWLVKYIRYIKSRKLQFEICSGVHDQCSMHARDTSISAFSVLFMQQ